MLSRLYNLIRKLTILFYYGEYAQAVEMLEKKRVMEFEKKETKQQREKIWGQVIAILIATMASFLSGALFCWPTQALPILLDEKRVTVEQGSYFAVIPSIASIIPSSIFAHFLDNNGRKLSLFLVVILQLSSWIMTSLTKSIYLLYLARIVYGFSEAGYYSVVPTYIAEVATPNVRGSWGNCASMFSSIGILVANITIFNFQLEISALGFSVASVLLLVLLLFIPETPYYYLIKKQEDAAVKSLRWLRRKEDVQAEIKQLMIDVERQSSEEGGWKDVFRIASNRKALGIGAFLRCAQQFSGISSFSIYAHFIFAQGGQTLQPITSTIIFNCLICVTNFFAAFVLDRLGRRFSMIFSCFGCSIILALESSYFYLSSETNIDLTHFKLFPIIGMCIYVLFHSIGLGIMPTLMLGELFSSSVKGKCLCLMIILYGLLLAFCTKLFQILMTSLGLHVAFALFSVCCMISTIGSYLLVPETSRRTLEEIQQSFKK